MTKEQNKPVIEIKNLVKSFGKTKALDGLTFTVKQGQVHGFLGPNGSGKSTTIRILLGLLQKTSGDVRLFEQDPWQAAVTLHKRLAYVPGDVNFWPNVSGGEIIDLLGDLRGGIDQARREHLLHVFELDPRKKFRTYSKGNRQKVALVAALAADVELYILDEPTSGLDPLMESIFQDEVRKLKQQGKTILLSSHILAEVESLCDTVTIIRGGKVVESGSLHNIRSKHHIIMTIISPDKLDDLESLDGVRLGNAVAGGVRLEVDAKAIDSVIKALHGRRVVSLISEPPSLEHLFMQHYEEEK